MSLREAIKQSIMSHPGPANAAYGWVQRLGLHINPGRHPVSAVLQLQGINHVLDVGANEGGFGRRVRLLGYRGPITSFEPLPHAFKRLEGIALADGNWHAVPCALGNEDEQREIVVHQRSNLSSFLPSTTFMDAHFGSSERGSHEVSVRRLDSWAREWLTPTDRCLLKIDTQGFEIPVLEGGCEALAQVQVILVELTYRKLLYEGEPTSLEVIHYLHERGFTLVHLEPLYYNLEEGELLQGDGLFVRM